MTQSLGEGGYRTLADEIGEVLMSAAAAAEKMQDEAREEAARSRTGAEAEVRMAYAEGRRILDDARMEADMIRAEAEWQSKEALAQARRVAGEQLAAIDSRLAELARAEELAIGRVAGAGVALAETLSRLQAGRSILDVGGTQSGARAMVPARPDEDPAGPEAKIYFVEFPPLPAADQPAHRPARAAPDEVILDEPGPSPVAARAPGDDRSEWAPPAELPAWWTEGGAQG